MPFIKENVIYDPRPDFPFVVTANRYWDPSSQQLNGFTLVLAHGTGFHKEQWEPTLKHLFLLSKGSTSFPILEAWSIECPNHGESAAINEDAILRGGYGLIFPWQKYVHTLYLFLTQSTHMRSSKRNFIAIGHSMGAVSLALTQTYPNPPVFTQIILCEPMMLPTDMPEMDPALRPGATFSQGAGQRKDFWPSREDAYKFFKSRKKSFASWDDEVLRIFVEHGLRKVPTSTYPHEEVGVTLSCTKLQEVACYRDSMSAPRAYDFLPVLCRRLPVHIVWGAINDALTHEVKTYINNANTGGIPSSTSYVEGAGHLVVQVAPRDVAEAIFSAMSKGRHKL